MAGGGGVDRFRIKIWDKDNGDAIVYDNQQGDADDAAASDAVEAGSIVIHKDGSRSSASVAAEAVEASEQAELPQAYALAQNHPNPFNPETEISFALPEASEVRLVVYDALGREVGRLVEGPMAAGVHRVRFEGSGLPSGVYLYHLTAGTFTQVRRMILLK